MLKVFEYHWSPLPPPGKAVVERNPSPQGWEGLRGPLGQPHLRVKQEVEEHSRRQVLRSRDKQQWAQTLEFSLEIT